MRYVVTGGTGFIGRRVVSRLLQRSGDAEVWVTTYNTNEESPSRFERLALNWGERAKPLGETPLTDIEHVVDCATDLEGTRAAVELARRLGATLHHVSSIAVMGDFQGDFTERDFDVGQNFPSQYQRARFDAELSVRSEPGLSYRVYRPGIVVGDSRTGETDTIDGPYRFFGLLAKLAKLPSVTPILLPDSGRINVVPVDYVVDALMWLIHTPHPDGQTFHLTAETPIGLHGIYRGVAPAAGLPPLRGALPVAVATPLLRARGQAKVLRNVAATQLGLPAQLLDTARPGPAINSDATRQVLHGSGINVPEFASYAPRLWQYWAAHLDPDRARRGHLDGPLVGRHVIITGASSGIGRASAIAVAQRGATVFALARSGTALNELVTEITSAGGDAHAFACDITDPTSVEHTVKDILGRFGHVDYLVNNAGRSIRRSGTNSTDRFHDYERVMAVNYFGAVRMVLALLPHWRERQFGHVVNVSTSGVQARNPRYSAYLASKAALDTFSDVLATETLSDHITFTNIHMPLVLTPMILPSRNLNIVRPISAEHAAAMVVRGLTEKPTRIDTPSGTIAEAGNYLAPKLSRRILHQLYLGYPESAAAQGLTTTETDRQLPIGRPAREGRRIRVPRIFRRAVRRVPGMHW